jgi:hypothetical protein
LVRVESFALDFFDQWVLSIERRHSIAGRCAVERSDYKRHDAYVLAKPGLSKESWVRSGVRDEAITASEIPK